MQKRIYYSQLTNSHTSLPSFVWLTGEKRCLTFGMIFAKFNEVERSYIDRGKK